MYSTPVTITPRRDQLVLVVALHALWRHWLSSRALRTANGENKTVVGSQRRAKPETDGGKVTERSRTRARGRAEKGGDLHTLSK